MDRFIARTKINSDGSVHVNLPVGSVEPGTEVQVTVQPVAISGRPVLTAAELMNSGLVGLWADRTDIGDSVDFARGLRDQAQTRRRH